MEQDKNISDFQSAYTELKKLYDLKADIISVNAHQIKTSLSATKWILHMFLSGDLGKLTNEQENLLKKAEEDNERSIGVVTDILRVNREENINEKAYEFSKLDLIKIIDDCIFDFSGEANSRNIELIFLKPEDADLPEINADKEKIRVVFQNLLENAIKYSNKDSKVFLSIKEKDANIEITVKDTGIGISDEAKDKIFQKFYRDPRAEEKEILGSGIGLYTIKKIVEEHGGKIYFESKVNEGTTFIVDLPIHR